MKNIYSITISFNPDISLLRRQMESLKGQVDVIVIVDNGSTNITELKKFYQKLAITEGLFLLLYNQKNMGLGHAQNVGIKAAIANNASDILLLDQDSVLEADCIKNMLQSRAELINAGIKLGAIGPVYFSEITNQVYPITRFWGPFIKRIEPSAKPEEASFLIASGCLINVEVIKKVGFMNEDLFIDCIDVDWSFRAKAKGYKLFATPKARMMHTIGEKRMNVAGRSIAIHSPLRRYYLFRNSIFMVRSKNIPIGYKIREIVFNTLRLIIYFSTSKERLKYLKYSVNGFKDGLLNVAGECPHKF